MDFFDAVRWLHVLGACVLIGTGSGIAFFMVMAHRTKDPAFIGQTAKVVVTADLVFTATAAIIQPITGYLLMEHIGWQFTDRWLMLSLGLYLFIGFFWLPVVVIQAKMRDEALEAANSGSELSKRYHRLYKVWFAFGIPAFTAIALLLWLMVIRPDINI